MTIRTLTKFRNTDLTSDLNHRLRNLALKGVFFGGNVTPVAGILQIDIQPFAAVGSDGMVTILEGLAERISVASGATQWVLLHAEYRSNTSPIAALEVLTITAYNALTDEAKNARIKLAKITVPTGAIEVETSQILFTEADHIDPMDRSPFRGNVATKNALPDWTDPPTGETVSNRHNDIYFVEDERLFYSWVTTGIPQWTRIVSAAEEVALANHKRNQDDGTVPPDFFEAQHITVAQRESLDGAAGAAPASVKTFGPDGVPYGAGNTLVDEQYPVLLNTAQTFNLTNATEIQLTGKIYVGHGITGTGQYFLKLAYPSLKQFTGSDGYVIGISSVRDSTNTFELNPASDADALGFYEDPWVTFDFSLTDDTMITASVIIFHGTQRAIGQITPLDRTYELLPVGFVPHADHIGLARRGSTNVQAAFDLLAFEPLYYGSVVTVGPVGSNADFEGNDHTPFRNALNRLYTHTAGKRSGTIKVLPGDYTFSQPVLLQDPGTSTALDFIKIEGVTSSGQRPVLSVAQKTDRARIYASGTHVGPFFTVTGNQTAEFRGIHMDASRTSGAPAGGGCIDINTLEPNNSCYIADCSFGCDTSTMYDAAYIRQSSLVANKCGDVSILNCTFETARFYNYGHHIDICGGSVTIDGNKFSRGTTATGCACDIISINTGGTLHTNAKIRVTNNQIIGTTGQSCVEASFIKVTALDGSLLVRGNQALVDPAFGSTSPWLNLASAGEVVVSDNYVVWNSYIAVLNGTVGTFRVINNSFQTTYQFGRRLNRTSYTDISHNSIIADVDRSDVAAPARVFNDTGYFRFMHNDWKIQFTQASTETRNLYIVSAATISGNRFVVVPATATNYTFNINITGTDVSFTDNYLDWTNTNCTFTDGISLLSGSARCLIKGNRLVGKTGWEAARLGIALRAYLSNYNVFEGNLCYNWGVFATDDTTTGSVFSGNKAVSCNRFLLSANSTNLNFSNNQINAATDWAALDAQYGFAAITGAAGVQFRDNTMAWAGASHNILGSSTHPVVYVTGNNVTIADNVWEYKGANYGVYVGSGNGVHILRNKMGTLDASLWSSTPSTIIGILVSSSTTLSRVEGNEIVKVARGTAASGGNYAAGISVQAPGTKIIGNYIGGAGTTAANLNDSIYGIFTSSAAGLEIVDNYITNFRWIGYIVSASYSVINNNRGYGCLAGLYAESGYCSICNNIIDFNGLTDTGGYAYEGVNDNHVACLAAGSFSKVIGNTFVGLPDAANATAARVIRGISASLGTCLVGNSIDAAYFCTTGIHMSYSYPATMNICAFNHLNRVGYRRASGSPQCYGIRIEGSSTNNDYHHPLIFGNIIGQSGSQYLGPSAYGIYWNISVQVGTVCYGGTIAFNTISAQGGGHWMTNGAIVITDGGGAGRMQEVVVMGNQLHGLGFTDNGTNTFGLGTPSQLNNI